MNPQELVKGCGWSNWCNESHYCHTCKTRMEQALFEKKEALLDIQNILSFIELSIDNLKEDIEILEKALNIHSTETKVRFLSKPERDASSVISGASSSGRIPLNNQEVKPCN